MFEVAQVEKVIRHLVRFGSSPADAEDLAQETLLLAWRKQAERHPDGSLDAWLYGIARNLYRNHHRTRRTRATEPTADPEAAAPPSEPALADVLALQAALGALPEAQQDLVILHELEGYTLKEAAAMLAVPVDTAKDRLKRARADLRVAMRGAAGDTTDAVVDAAVARERSATSRVAKASAAAVLAGVLAGLGRSGTAAAAGAVVGASAVVGKGGAAVAAVVAALVGGVAIGVIADRTLAPARAVTEVAPARAPIAAASPPPVAAPPASAPPLSTAAAPAAPATIPPPASAAPRAPAPRPAPPSPTGVDAEAQLIERARAALARGDRDEALRALMAHERQFPQGQLTEERDVLAIEAYVAAGRSAIARERIAAYRRDFPGGLHADRVSAAEAALAAAPP